MVRPFLKKNECLLFILWLRPIHDPRQTIPSVTPETRRELTQKTRHVRLKRSDGKHQITTARNLELFGSKFFGSCFSFRSILHFMGLCFVNIAFVFRSRFFAGFAGGFFCCCHDWYFLDLSQILYLRILAISPATKNGSGIWIRRKKLLRFWIFGLRYSPALAALWLWHLFHELCHTFWKSLFM